MSAEYESEVTCTGESAKAIRVVAKGGKSFWVPKSVIHDDSEVYGEGHVGKLVVQDWFAEKENWE